MWIEKRALQHRAYCRNPLPEQPSNRDNVVCRAQRVRVVGKVVPGVLDNEP